MHSDNVDNAQPLWFMNWFINETGSSFFMKIFIHKICLIRFKHLRGFTCNLLAMFNRQRLHWCPGMTHVPQCGSKKKWWSLIPTKRSHQAKKKSSRARGGWLEPIGQYVLTSFEMLNDDTWQKHPRGFGSYLILFVYLFCHCQWCWV